MSRRRQSPQRYWTPLPEDSPARTHLSRELGLLPPIAQLLLNRGIQDAGEAAIFVDPRLSQLRPPHLKDMDRAVERVLGALAGREKIVIYGDYDVDGITATSLLLLFFRELGADATFYIPDRTREGYGLHEEALNQLKKEGTQLVITVDCGISNQEAVLHARSLGLDVIVTDHHEPADILPPACAVVNPKQRDCPFPFKGLAGVGVAFYLASALRARLREKGAFRRRREPDLKAYLDLVALGTIGDVAPLREENRVLVRYGLVELARSSRPGIIALKEVCGLSDAVIDSQHVAFRLAPRLNAAGRVSRAETGLYLLTTTDGEEARRLAACLDQENTRRQRLEGEVLAEAEAMLEAKTNIQGKKALVLAREGWPVGLLGLIAGRLAEAYYRPTVVISFEDGRGKGSARSIPPFNLFQGIKDCAHLLEGFGGHAHAAGLSLKRENLEDFERLLEEVADASLSEADWIPRLELDALLSLEEVTEELLGQLQQLSPFGPGNPEPIFAAFGLKVLRSRVVGENHLRLQVGQDGRAENAIAFGLGHFQAREGEYVDLAFTPEFNEWQGKKDIQLRVSDIRSVHGNQGVGSRE